MPGVLVCVGEAAITVTGCIEDHMQALGFISPSSQATQSGVSVSRSGAHAEGSSGIDLVVNISDCPVPRRGAKPSNGTSRRRTYHTSIDIDGIAEHDWGTPASDVALTVMSRVVDALGALGGSGSLNSSSFDFTVIYTATSMFTASLASRFIEVLRGVSSLGSCVVTAVPLLRPAETSGRAAVEVVHAMQVALAYCDIVILRGFDDYLSLYDRNSMAASFEDLCACLASDLVGWLLVRAACPGFGLLACGAHSKLCDVRSSLWKRCCFPQTTPTASSSSAATSNPMRSLTANVHALHMSSIELTERTQLLWMPADIAVPCYEVAYFRTKPKVEATRQPAVQPSFDPVPASLQGSVDLTELAKQLRAAAPGVRWGRVQVVEPLGAPDAEIDLRSLKPSSGRSKRVASTSVSSDANVTTAGASSSAIGGGNTASVHAVLAFPSPYAEAQLRVAMQSASALLCSGGCSFILDRSASGSPEWVAVLDALQYLETCLGPEL